MENWERPHRLGLTVAMAQLLYTDIGVTRGNFG
jgi:hypothetical protein